MNFCKPFLFLILQVPLFACAQSELSNRLFDEGVQLYNNRNYLEAATVFAKCDSIDRLEMDSLDQRIAYSKMWESRCYIELGDTTKALQLSPYCIFNPIDRRKTCMSDSLANAGVMKSHQGDMNGAILDFIKCSEIEKSTLGENNIWYINSISNIGSAYMSIGQFVNAEPWMEKSEKKIAEVWGMSSDRHIESLYGLGLCSIKLNNIEEYNYAKELLSRICDQNAESNYASYAKYVQYLFFLIKEKNDTTQLMDELTKFYKISDNVVHNLSDNGQHDFCLQILRYELSLVDKLIGRNNNIYLDLENCAIYENEQVGNYNKATELCIDALSILEEYDMSHTELYYDFVIKAAFCLTKLGDRNTAIKLYEEILPDLTGTEKELDVLFNLSNRCYDEKDYITANVYAEKIDSICKERELCQSYMYVKTLLMLSWYNANLENPEESQKYARKAFELINTLNLAYDERIDALDRYITICTNTENRAEEILGCKEILKVVENRDIEKYIYYLNILGLAYQNIWENALAVKCSEKCVELQRELTGEENGKYAEYLYYLGANYMGNDQYEEARKTLLEYERIKDNLNVPYSKNQIYNALGTCEGLLGNHEKAIEYMHKSIDECKSHNLGYGIVLTNIATEYAGLGMYNKSVEYMSKVPENILLAIDGGQLRNYYEYLYLTNDSTFRKYFFKYNNYALKKIINTYMTLNTQERISFYRMFEDHFDINCPKYAYETNSDDIVSNAYQATILSKGLLLNSEIETRKIVQESNDSSVISLYDRLIEQKKQLTKLYESNNLNFTEIDSLSDIIQYNEEQLCYKSKDYKRYLSTFNVNWKDIRKTLKKNDIAIEFISYKENNDVIYFALTLKSDYKVPKLIPLFNERQLMANLNNDVYKNNKLYNFIWEPFNNELRNIKNVYFSPTGKLHSINIECLPGLGDFDDDRNYCRLSSTRQLVNENADVISNGASVYGGLQYNTDMNTIVQDSRQYPNSRTRAWDEALLSTDSIDVRDGWQYLPGTLIEAKEVSTTLKNASVPTYLFTDTIGTEASFKALDGKGRKIIHISTHGFYFTENDSTKMHKAGLDFMHFGDEHQQRYVEDKSLTRSGLLFTGCNTKLRGGDVPDGVDDGILFAKEISNLDLRGLDLVTLSACETGLGDISGEGVFGLQRAFKKAGAQSILMSLWKVDDNATRLLMTRFYENYLLKSMSKAEALKDAQHYIRTYENGRYNDPKYWAAFIILDAI